MDDLDRKIQGVMPRYGTSAGHGQVWPRPDGWRIHCGAGSLCDQCTTDRIDLKAARQRVAESVL